MDNATQHRVTVTSGHDAKMRPYLPLRACAGWSRADWLVASALFLLSLGLYTAFLAPTLSTTSMDSAELITKSALLQVAHIPGSPVYIWLGHLFSMLPFGEIAYRVNFMSAFTGAVAVAALYAVIVRHVTGERVSAAGGAALFALSLTFWSQVEIAELYAPNMGFLAVAVLAVLEWGAASSSGARGAARWWLAAASLAFGLSLGVHLSNILYLPAFGLFAAFGLPVRRGPHTSSARSPLMPLLRHFDSKSGLISGALAAAAVAVPYGWVYLKLPYIPPGDFFPKAEPGWPLFYASVLNAFHELRFAYTLQEIPDRIALFLHLFERNLGPVGLPLAFAGMWRLLFTRTRVFYLFIALALANVVFYVNYRVPDNDVFYIPTYWVASGFAAVGLQAAGLFAGALARAARRGGRAPVPATLSEGRKLGFHMGAAGPQGVPGLPWLLTATLAVAGVGWNWQYNHTYNDLSGNISLREFFGNVFSILPQGANIYHRGAAMGYDLLYYTLLCGVRPDLYVQAGTKAGEPPPGQVPWPRGPVFSGVTEHEFQQFLPNFLYNPGETNPKWYEPVLTGMFRWEEGAQYGWLNLYKVHPHEDIPMNWMVPIKNPESLPSKPLHIRYTSLLELSGVDADPVATPGKPWRLVRYWYTTGTWIPPMVVIFGDRLAMETHIPLNNQFDEYVEARNIKDLGLYVIKDEMRLVIPSNIPPGKYTVYNAVAEPRLVSLLLDPAAPGELVAKQHPVATVEVVANPGEKPPNPFAGVHNGRCTR